MLIILSLKDIGVSSLRWILELVRKGFPRKIDDIISSVQNFLITHPRPNPLFVYGHKSHLTYQLSVFCNKLKIEIITLSRCY